MVSTSSPAPMPQCRASQVYSIRAVRYSDRILRPAIVRKLTLKSGYILAQNEPAFLHNGLRDAQDSGLRVSYRGGGAVKGIICQSSYFILLSYAFNCFGCCLFDFPIERGLCFVLVLQPY